MYHHVDSQTDQYRWGEIEQLIKDGATGGRQNQATLRAKTAEEPLQGAGSAPHAKRSHGFRQ
jgi:hypothetical protein